MKAKDRIISIKTKVSSTCEYPLSKCLGAEFIISDFVWIWMWDFHKSILHVLGLDSKSKYKINLLL